MAEQQGQPEKKRRKPRMKRAHGEGSVFELKGRDRKKPWVAQITLENGKKKQTYHVTQQEAIAARRKMLNELEQGLLATSSRQTVKQYLEHWLENVQSPPQVRVSTYEMYRRLLKNHILPALGHLPLSRLTPQHVQAFYADKLKAGLSPRTVQIMHALLHRALENAVRWRLVPRNICEDVSSPRAARYEMQSLTRDQAQRLMEAARGHRFEVLLLLALVTGMRRGELLSLRWKDIQLEEKCLHVRHTVARIAGHGYVENEPKTAQSRRKITLPDFVVEALRQHRTQQLEARLKAGASWKDHDLVFCNTHGGFLNTDYLRRRFLRLLKDAGLPQMRFHDLRHSAATILLSLRVPPNVVKEILGHSDIGITLGIYGHVLPGMHEEAMDKWNDLFHEQR